MPHITPFFFEQCYTPIPEIGCFIWNMSRDTSGYGILRTGKGLRGAHKVAYELYVGPVPEGIHVLHSCLNRDCINYKHLRLGSNKDNMADREKLNRNGMAKLTIEQVHEIRVSKEFQYIIARRYKINQSQVSKIKTGARRSLV